MYIWCLHCECVYPSKDWRKKGQQYGFCPNCGASEFTDGWNWSKLVKYNGYPKIPEVGKHYPLYPESGEKF
ncbi:hypothetical protein DNHGIG_32100 [Collibacillus ludicampi]|uniref:Uncharacterized protein n=1 Tax=Collibacillus ludicampi TaxID=2771369 RepID=A0AAV4LIT2_9BACL|nr:hypothetical protein DNHGIG_32100 [Collibacillus ludicampi]